MFVVERNKVAQIVAVLFLYIFRTTERIPPEESLRILEALLTQLSVIKGMVALERNLLYSDLLPTVYGEGYDYSVDGSSI